jgi:hypothetical protein
MAMKALSLRQPWANAVLYLGKTIENRRWNTHFRGTFLIHAAKSMTEAEYRDAVDFCEETLGVQQSFTIDAAFGRHPGTTTPLHRGGIVGIATIVRVIPPCYDRVQSLFAPPACVHPWHIPDQYGFLLEDVRPLPFLPCNGALGFFDMPTMVYEELDAIAKAFPRTP